MGIELMCSEEVEALLDEHGYATDSHIPGFILAPYTYGGESVTVCVLNPRNRAALLVARAIERLEATVAAVRWGRRAGEHRIQFSPPRWLYRRSADGSVRSGGLFVAETKWEV